MTATHGLGWLLESLALIGVVYVLTATILTLRFMTRAKLAPVSFPAMTLVKPLHGDHPGLAESLAGFCDQDYPGEVQIILGVQAADDAAIAVVRTLQRAYPDRDIELVIDPRQHGTNRKVSNLINIAERARHDVLVLSDADIGVKPDYLRQVVGALLSPGVGAVSCLYVGKPDASPWSRLGAMAISYQFMPNAVLGKSIGLAHPCFGSTIALTRKVLGEIGGLAAFRDHLADDYEIGQAVRDRGYAIAIPPMTVTHLSLEPTFAALVDHEMRWARTLRQIDPKGYAGSLVTYPLPLAVAAALVLQGSPSAIGLFLLAAGVRIACKFAMDAATGAPVGRWWMIPARDLLSFGVFIASFTVDTVGWQGRRFKVGRDGVLSHT